MQNMMGIEKKIKSNAKFKTDLEKIRRNASISIGIMFVKIFVGVMAFAVVAVWFQH